MPLIGLLVLNRDGRQWLTSVFPSLRQQDYPNKRIYLIDNGSQDDSLDLTMGHYPEVTIIRIPTNLGYAMAYNLAMPIAFADGCQWVIWANNDIRLEPECLKELSLAAQSSLLLGRGRFLPPGAVAGLAGRPGSPGPGSSLCRRL
ncbi:MAG: glycosyltransferase [Deltaproteobacteria bacterium]|nr:glycosyltransferase [Deltaproteobacteria bacterium]